MNRAFIHIASAAFFIFLPAFLMAGNEGVHSQQSAVVKVVGIVRDKITRQPVEAMISYQKKPYGSIVGVSRSAANIGNYNFYVPGNSDFSVTIKADGYTETTLELSIPENYDVDSMVYDIELAPLMIGRTIRLEKLIFEQGRYDITSDSYEELDNLVKMLAENPRMVIRLEGHTDFRGGAKANMALSRARVEAVKNYLVKQGIGEERITTKAFGGSNPITREDTEEGRRLNRRVEVRIIKN